MSSDMESGSGASARPRAASSSARSPAAGSPRPSRRSSVRLAEQSGHIALVHDQTALERDDPVGAHDLVHLLGDVDDREALRAQAAHRLQHLRAARRVQHRRRLVEHEHTARHGQDPRERRPLLLATGEQVRLAHPELRQAEPVQHLVDPAQDLLRRPRQVLEAERDVVLHALGDELVLGVLEEDADLAPGGEAAAVGQQVVPAGDGHGRPGRLLQPAEQARQRGLAGPVGADDGDELARHHGQVDPGEGVEGSAGIAVRELADLEQRLGGARATAQPRSWTSRRGEAS